MFPIIAELLERFNDRLDTRAIVVDKDALSKGIPALLAHLEGKRWVLAADENTWEVAGKRTAALLEAEGVEVLRYEIKADIAGEAPMCSDELIDVFQAFLKDSGATSTIAIGAGTVNDIVKKGSHNLEIPMACVATAPSMNGYTSGIAAVLSEGVKTTTPCRAPRVVIADVDIMAESPYRMICSGLGDLMSKPVSNADWLLSAWLNDSFHSSEAMEIIEAGAAMLEGVAAKLPERDRDAVAGLTASLMLSGLAMSVAGSSSPASGGEHLISHFIDMTAIAFDEPHDFHGCQVGVGTVTTAFLYEKLQALDRNDIDVDRLVDALLPWEEYEAQLESRFGPLFSAVVKHARDGYPKKEELRQRLNRLKENWEFLETKVRRTLRSSTSLKEELLSAQCPVLFQELGVDRDRAFRAITHSKDIRNRYTILHLAWELGLLDQWSEEALQELE